MSARPPRAPPIIAPTGASFCGDFVYVCIIPVLDEADGKSLAEEVDIIVDVDDIVAMIEEGIAWAVDGEDAEAIVTVFSRVDVTVAACDEGDMAPEGREVVGTARKRAEPGEFAHVIYVYV